MAKSPVTIRLEPEDNERLIKQAAKSGCTKIEYVFESLMAMLERAEQRPTPRAVLEAMPRRVGNGMVMPDGIVHDRWT